MYRDREPPNPNAPIYFDGVTYDPPQDESRLRTQLWRVFVAMTDEREHTLAWLAEQTGGSEASVSARLRDLRKPRFGRWTVERRRLPDASGLFVYRLRPKPPPPTPSPAPKPATPPAPALPLRQGNLFSRTDADPNPW